MKVYRMIAAALATVVVNNTVARDAWGQRRGETAAPTTSAAVATSTRVYDVRDIVAQRRDFPLTSSAYAQTFIAPAGQGVHDLTQNSQGPTNQVLGQGGQAMAKGGSGNALAYDPVIDEVIKLIMTGIDRDNWTDMGGAIGRISQFNGMLVITQTDANHEQIAALLRELSREQGGMVRVTADWLLMSPLDAAKLVKKPAGQAAEDALQPVDSVALQNAMASGKRFSAQTLSRNGQTVYLISGLSRSVVTSATPVVSTGVAAYSVDVSNVGGGIALEINPRVNWDQRSAVVTLFSTFSDPARVPEAAIPIGGTATTRPSAEKQTTLVPSDGSIQPFSRTVQDMRTTVRLPLGAPVIVGSMTLRPESGGGDEQQLVLILKVTASK